MGDIIRTSYLFYTKSIFHVGAATQVQTNTTKIFEFQSKAIQNCAMLGRKIIKMLKSKLQLHHIAVRAEMYDRNGFRCGYFYYFSDMKGGRFTPRMWFPH